ncbi:hypothetical protein LCGC14_2280990, partial [marine sediment metagenome]
MLGRFRTTPPMVSGETVATSPERPRSRGSRVLFTGLLAAMTILLVAAPAAAGPEFPNGYSDPCLGMTDIVLPSAQGVEENEEGCTISGVKFNDLNGNGARDAGEPGLGGWTIYADDNDNGARDAGELFAVTDPNGNYTITGFPGFFCDLVRIAQSPCTGPGFKLREELQNGWVCTFPANCFYDEAPFEFKVVYESDSEPWPVFIRDREGRD